MFSLLVSFSCSFTFWDIQQSLSIELQTELIRLVILFDWLWDCISNYSFENLSWKHSDVPLYVRKVYIFNVREFSRRDCAFIVWDMAGFDDRKSASRFRLQKTHKNSNLDELEETFRRETFLELTTCSITSITRTVLLFSRLVLVVISIWSQTRICRIILYTRCLR